MTTDPASITAGVAEQVAALRKRRGWTQAKLAGQLGFSEDVVQQLETGRRGISVEDLCQLAYLLGSNPTDLLAGSFLPEARRVPLRGKKIPKTRFRAWAAGEPGAALPGQDERSYDENVSAQTWLARKRLEGLEELQRQVTRELPRYAADGDEARIDECLQKIQGQVEYVLNVFMRKRGTAVVRPKGGGKAELVRGNPDAS